jgi:hypothetical protein
MALRPVETKLPIGLMSVERYDGMDDENYHAREVYANFGLFHAQREFIPTPVITSETVTAFAIVCPSHGSRMDW